MCDQFRLSRGQTHEQKQGNSFYKAFQCLNTSVRAYVSCRFSWRFVLLNRQVQSCKQANKMLLSTLQTYPPFGSAVSQRPLQWPHRHVGAPPRWEQSRGSGGPTGSSPRSTRPRPPAAACTGGALPGTAALGGRGGGGGRRGEREVGKRRWKGRVRENLAERKELIGEGEWRCEGRGVEWKKEWKIKSTKSLGKCRKKEDKQREKSGVRWREPMGEKYTGRTDGGKESQRRWRFNKKSSTSKEYCRLIFLINLQDLISTQQCVDWSEGAGKGTSEVGDD